MISEKVALSHWLGKHNVILTVGNNGHCFCHFDLFEKPLFHMCNLNANLKA